MAPNPLLRIRSPAKKTFGEAFGAATGVSDPRLQKIPIRNNNAGGKAATVAGYVGPGFHYWPSGHIPQDNDSETASPHPVPCPTASPTHITFLPPIRSNLISFHFRTFRHEFLYFISVYLGLSVILF